MEETTDYLDFIDRSNAIERQRIMNIETSESLLNRKFYDFVKTNSSIQRCHEECHKLSL